MAINDPHKARMPYGLDEDIDNGFKKAVNNSQSNLAMQYLRLILARDAKELADLRDRVSKLESEKTTTPRKATAKKADPAE